MNDDTLYQPPPGQHAPPRPKRNWFAVLGGGFLALVALVAITVSAFALLKADDTSHQATLTASQASVSQAQSQAVQNSLQSEVTAQARQITGLRAAVGRLQAKLAPATPSAPKTMYVTDPGELACIQGLFGDLSNDAANGYILPRGWWDSRCTAYVS